MESSDESISAYSIITRYENVRLMKRNIRKRRGDGLTL